MMKVILSFAVIAFVSKVNSQMQPQLPVIQFDMNDFMAHQQQMHAEQMHRNQQPMQHMEQHPMHAHEQGREMQEEPIVGSGLLAPHLLHPLGWGLGLPGLRYSKLSAGHLGGLSFANSMLGAGNPMEAEDPQLERVHHHHHIDSNLGAPMHYQLDQHLAAMPQHQHYQLEPQVGNPQHPQEFFHLLGAGAPVDHQPIDMLPNIQVEPMHLQPQQFQVAAPQFQQFEMQPLGPPIPQNMQILPAPQMPLEDGARTWGWKHNKGYGYDKGYVDKKLNLN